MLKAYFDFSGEFHGISEESRDEKLKLLVGLIAEYKILGAASVIPHNLSKSTLAAIPIRRSMILMRLLCLESLQQ